jgi:thymidylate kinase
MAKLVVCEGHDKAGKATQSKLLVEAYSDAGLKSTRVEVPSVLCGRTHRLIYRMLKNGWAKKLPNVFQFVQFLNKWVFQVLHLPTLMKHNDVVVLDRWSLSAVIYGGATGVNNPFNMLLFHLLKKPDVTVVFHGQSFRRNTVDDSYEKDTELQARVKEGYHAWALAHPSDHVLIDNRGGNVQDIHRNVVTELATKHRVP